MRKLPSPPDVVPFAIGGPSEASNIQLRCRAHNLYEADLFFGADVVRESTVRWGDSNATGLGAPWYKWRSLSTSPTE